MSKSILYFIIIILLGVVGYLLLRPEATVIAPTTPSSGNSTTSNATAESTQAEQSTTAGAEESNAPGNVVFTGTLVGFADGKDEFLGSYKYALINDGIEILRIDLRPLIGYDVTNIETDLGITEGATVTLTGSLVDSGFEVTTMKLARE